MAKKALVISGGGSRGAFAVGAVNELLKQFPTLTFDIFVGTSTGSLIVPLVALNKMDLLQQLYTTVHTNDIVLGGNIAQRLLNEVSIFDATPLMNLVEKYHDDENSDALFQSGKEVFICTTCLQTCDTVVFSTQAPPQSEHTINQVKNNQQFRSAVIASANQPVFMQPIEVIDGAQPVMQYVDGGVREVIGIQIAIDAGADEIIAISLAQPEEPDNGIVYTKAYKILMRTLDIYSKDVDTNNVKMPMQYAGMLDYINAVKQNLASRGVNQNDIDGSFSMPSFKSFQRAPIKIHLLSPNSPLGGGEGGLTFDPDEMKGMLQQGQLQMQNCVASLPPGSSLFV